MFLCTAGFSLPVLCWWFLVHLWGILVCGLRLLFCPFLALSERNAGLVQQAGKCSSSFLEETVKPRRPGCFRCGRSLEGSGGGCLVGRCGWTEGSCPCGRAPAEPPAPGAAARPRLDSSLCRSRWSFTIYNGPFQRNNEIVDTQSYQSIQGKRKDLTEFNIYSW